MTVIYLILILTGAVVFDLSFDKIPNRYLIAGFLFLTVQRIGEVGFGGIGLTIVTCFIPLILLFPLFVLGLMGGGDIKCILLTCLCFSVRGVILTLVVSLFIAGIISIAKLIRFKFHGDEFANLIRYLIKTTAEIRMHGVSAADESQLFIRMDGISVKERGIHFSLPVLLAAIVITWGSL